MDLIEVVKATDVVGTDGAGLPAHVKLSARMERFVVNGVERKPLVETNRYSMCTFPDQIAQAVGAVVTHVGAKGAVIALKKKYVEETAALWWAITTSSAWIELSEMSSFYLAGDEQMPTQQVCGTSIPERRIPLDVGAVVDNVGVLLNIHDAPQRIPVIEKYLSVVGEMKHPVTRKVPFGIPPRECIDSARPHLQDYIVIVGDPMMGCVMTDPTRVGRLAVTKTTGSLTVLSNECYLARRAAPPPGRIRTQAKSACAQCRMCVSLCPRYLIGHQIQPHLIMRNLFRGELISDDGEYEKVFGQAVNYCDCGVCEMLSCLMGLLPRKVNAYLRDRLREKGIQMPRNLPPKTREGSLYGKVPIDRLVTRLGLSKYYYRHAGDDCTELLPERVWISFRQRIGKPAVSAVQVGETVQEGDLPASAAQGLSADIHVSISGIIMEINEDGISIRRDRET